MKLASCAFALLCACSDDDSGGEITALEIGTGLVEFTSLSDGQELEVIAGTQGGYHFIVHARTQGIRPGDPQTANSPTNPTTQFTAFLENGDPAHYGQAPYRSGYVQDGEWQRLPSARILRLKNELIPDIYGERVRIALELRDSAGRSGTAEAWVTAAEPTIDDGEPDGGL